jgi:4-amino-4-deoxy-L-arabinose transferase-like glycosyltransferase
MARPTRQFLWADALVVATICLIALIVLAPLVASVHIAEYDEAIFLDLARNIQRIGLPLRSIAPAGVFFFDHTPLYPYLLSLYAQDGDQGLLLARSATVIAAFAAVALTYRFGSRFGSRRAGALAALLLAVNPFFAVHAFFVRMEMFMLLAMLAGFYTLVVGIEERKTSFLLASGISFALGVLFKEFALMGTAVAVGYTLWRRRRLPGTAISAAVIVGAPSLLALAGWFAWSWELSPEVFTATMKRWVESVTVATGLEPRLRITWTAWSLQLGSRLLGPGLVLGLLIALGRWVLRRDRAPHLDLLWAYTLVAIALSFVTSLKEPRHLVAILPAAALLAGHALTKIWDEWSARLPGAAGARQTLAGPSFKGVAAAVVIGIVVVFAGPLRPALLPSPASGGMKWVAPVYAERIANDEFYRILAMTGRRINAITAPDEVVTVVHQATVVAYYADRPYTMLYTLPSPLLIDEVLDGASVLVWDAPTFLGLESNEIERVQATVTAEFSLEEEVSDNRRSVGVYRRKVNHD